MWLRDNHPYPNDYAKENGKGSADESARGILKNGNGCRHGAREDKQKRAEEQQVTFDVLPSQVRCSTCHRPTIGFQLFRLKYRSDNGESTPFSDLS